MPVLGSLKCGDWEISLICAGRVKMDGGAIFGVVPKPLWNQRIEADDRNRVTLAMNCLLVQHEEECILIETGFGGKVNEKLREIYGLDEEQGLLASLSDAGVTPEQVTRVVVSHLHQDHAGGCTIQTQDGYEPTFPDAVYYVQQGEWDDAEKADGQTVNGYRLESVMRPLALAGCVTLLTGDSEICSGVRVILTPGHTRFHQSIIIETGEETFCYIGDLIPTTHHLKPIYILAYDLYPRDTFLNKQTLIARAFAENWILVWTHDLDIPWGRLTQDKRGSFFPVPL
jgi:glyoxylase-like metal-dependent hydrolase (beta-lactamase superfamily II)